MTPWSTVRIGPRPFIAVDHMGAGELLVFLHGIGGNKRNWHDNLPAFAERWHAVAWDARGYGDSDDYDGPLLFMDFSHDLARVLDHFGAAKAHIVGLSMGGRIAMQFAELYPDRLLTLTFCDTHRGFSHMPEDKKREFVRARKEPLLAGGEPKDIAVPVAKTLIGPKASQEAFGKLVDSMSRLHKQSYIKTIEATVMTVTDANLANIRVPTHVVVGADDRLSTPAVAEDLAARIPDAKLTVIPDAGHLSNIEKPAQFNEAVIRFILAARGKSAA
jgi:3-oxoadipate enol-lactonase